MRNQPSPAAMVRREFLNRAALGVAGAIGSSQFWPRLHAQTQSPVPLAPLPVAAVVTTYYPLSHADVLVGKILAGFQHDGGIGPGLKLESLYVDQHHERGMEQGLANKYGFRLVRSIDEAITWGTAEVQVSGVLSIGEHGDYPETPDTHQKMYPRRRFFEAISAALHRGGKSVPVFNDKHLAHCWQDAHAMYELARERHIPLLAGSSLPVAWRYPPLDLPPDCEIEAALAIGYGPLEAYGFHALETLQCMIERRKGGETGIASVQAVQGQEIQASAQRGDWSRELFAAARAAMPGQPTDTEQWNPTDDSAVYLMQHRDGLRSAVVMANGLANGFAFAAKLKGQTKPVATWFKLQDGGVYGHFSYLLHAFEMTVRSGAAVYPVERTLLTSGVLDRCMQSLSQQGVRIDTPELAIAYPGGRWPFANHSDSFMSLPNDP